MELPFISSQLKGNMISETNGKFAVKQSWVNLADKGYYTPNQKLACFVLYRSQNYQQLFWKLHFIQQIVQENQK